MRFRPDSLIRFFLRSCHRAPPTGASRRRGNLLLTTEKATMNFPLFVPTYEISGRIYRRNIQKSRRNEYEVNLGTGDTADLYGESDSYNSVDDNSSSDEMLSTTTTTTDSSDLLTTDDAAEEMESGDEQDEETSKANEEFVVKFNKKAKKWSAKMKIPVALRRFIIGPKGTTKKGIENETNCRLIFPSKKSKKRPIEILSMKSEECVMRCRDRIDLILLGARDRAAYTHFVSIPMTHEIVKENYAKFIDTIKNDEELSESCKNDAIFQEPGKLHLTITMLSLLDDDEQNSASKSLETAINDRIGPILDGKPLEADVSGLEIMNDDPTRVRVLYACVSSDKLADVANTIAEAMSDAGFAPQQDSVKIHLTLMNTRYAWEKKKKKERMDVAKLLEKYRDYQFGKVTIPKVHISSLTGPKDETGYYTSIATYALNRAGTETSVA